MEENVGEETATFTYWKKKLNAVRSGKEVAKLLSLI
jgi:hypothetical protein